MNESATRVHHIYSPSKLQSLESCPKYQSNFVGSEAAAMGTRQHDAAESGRDDEALPDEKAMAVAQCLAFVDERRALYPGHALIKEAYLPVDDERVAAPDGQVFPGTTGGYLDVGIISADQKTAEIWDFKFGAVPVEDAKFNLQSIAYLLGLVRLYPTLEKVTVGFFLPHQDDGLHSHTFLREQFDELRVRVRTVVGRAIEANKNPDDFSSARANVSACLFCANVGKCPAVAAVALKVGKKYSPIQIPDSVSTSIFENPAEVAEGLKVAGIVKAWAEDYRAQVTAKAIVSDFLPPGYKLVSTVKRKVIDARKFGNLAKDFLPEADREKVEALFEIPLGRVEKLISLAAPRGSKEATVESFGKAALDAGAVEEGLPFCFLRQNHAKE